MLIKNRNLSLLNSLGIMIGRTYLTEKKNKKKGYCDYGEFNSHSNEKVEPGQRNLRF